jgi:signal recognition particle receptor subunit beta
MEGKTVQLNVPIRIEQIEKLSKAVAIVMASRERTKENKRITKATFIRALIDVIDFDKADLKDISSEEDLQSAIKKLIHKEVKTDGEPLGVGVLSSIYKKFAQDDQKKWVAGDFINTLFENGLVKAHSSEELWTKILENPDDATK